MSFTICESRIPNQDWDEGCSCIGPQILLALIIEKVLNAVVFLEYLCIFRSDFDVLIFEPSVRNRRFVDIPSTEKTSWYCILDPAMHILPILAMLLVCVVNTKWDHCCSDCNCQVVCSRFPIAGFASWIGGLPQRARNQCRVLEIDENVVVDEE